MGPRLDQALSNMMVKAVSDLSQKRASRAKLSAVDTELMDEPAAGAEVVIDLTVSASWQHQAAR
ncbi:MAG: hypothetical protein ABIW46_00835 [Acidimicrobiales bacterium]